MKTYHDIVGDGGSNVAEQVGEQLERLQARLSAVGHVVAVMSGKGGVGKSSVSVNLAAALAMENYAVGLLDADINGPSAARMTGVRDQTLLRGKTGIKPALAAHNLRVMSIDLFLKDETTPVVWKAPTQKNAHTWRGLMEAAALREFLADSEWGELDLLILDLPPGTDRLSSLLSLVPNLAGTLIVTLPSGISQSVVGKSIRMAVEQLKCPVIGVVENMSAYLCPHCGSAEPLFPGGEARALAKSLKIPFLGSIPFDPRMAALADEGRNFLEAHRETPAGRAIEEIAAALKTFLKL